MASYVLNKKEHYLKEVNNHIEQVLQQLPYTPEDMEKIGKILRFYGRKKTIVFGRQPQALAAGIIYIYSRINFLGSTEKEWTQKNIARLCGVSESTVATKAKAVMKALKMELLDVRFARQSMAEKNPMETLMVDPATGLLFMEDMNLDIDGIPVRKKKSDYYFDAMEYLEYGETDQAIKLLKKALEIDEHFIPAFVGFAATYLAKGNWQKHKQYVEQGFEEVKKLYPTWPKEMLWGVIENRPVMRIICYQACIFHKEGDFRSAEALYLLLLKCNPGDNQGIRYLLSAMHAGLTPEDVDRFFDEGNKMQNWDKLESLLCEQNDKHGFWQPPQDPSI